MVGNASAGTPAFVIRQPRGRDLQPIHHLVDSTYEPMIARLALPPWPLRANVAQLIHSGTLWVLESEGCIAAAIRLDAHRTFVQLELVTVLPEFQRRRYGRALIEFAESKARSLRRSSMQLMTHERMLDAIGFYLHMGFVETRRANLQGHIFVYMKKAVAPRP